jgi:hypothetical protein
MAAKTFDEWWDSFPRERGTFSYECAKEGWNAAIKLAVENGNSLQQLKAKIAALADTIEECFQVDGNELGLLQVKKLRQLSAV